MACTKKETRAYINNGITYKYYYYGKNHKMITSFSVSKSDCDNLGM